MSTHNICFLWRNEKISTIIGWKKKTFSGVWVTTSVQTKKCCLAIIRAVDKRGIPKIFFLFLSESIHKAEQKHAQRKARGKASPTELSSSDLSCSIWDRHFRTKIGLISHLRTQKQ